MVCPCGDMTENGLIVLFLAISKGVSQTLKITKCFRYKDMVVHVCYKQSGIYNRGVI